MPCRGAHRSPWVERGHGRIGPEGEHHTAREHRRERIEGGRTLDTEPLRVHALRTTPGCVEGRLDARDHAQVCQELEILVAGHLQVLEAMTSRAQRVASDLLRSEAKAVRHDPRRTVADDVEPCLLSRQRRCRHMGSHVLCREVCRARRAGFRVQVGRRQACGVRADGAVDEEVTRRASCAEVTHRLLPVKLPPVADDLGHLGLATEFQRVEEILGTADRRAGVLVHARDPPCGSGAQRRALSTRALPRIHRPESGLPQGVMCRARYRTLGGPAVLGRSGGHLGSERRGCQGGVHVHAGEVRRAIPDAGVDLGGGRGPAFRPCCVIPSVPEQDASLGHPCGRLPQHA